MNDFGLLLAAGRSRRFGSDDKLSTVFRGRPLVAHAAVALRGAGVAACLAVVRSDAVARCFDDLGLEVIRVGPEADALSATLAAGVVAAAERGADGVLVALGDMPCVTQAQMSVVRDLGRRTGLAGMSDGTRRTPPAWFDESYFADLMALAGDTGAASLLRAAPESAFVRTTAGSLADIDTMSDLERLSDTE